MLNAINCIFNLVGAVIVGTVVAGAVVGLVGFLNALTYL